MLKKRYFYIGNMDKYGTAGITILLYEEDQCKFYVVKTVYPHICASRIIIDEGRELLFCIDEKICNGEEEGGRVYSFRINNENGDLIINNWRRTYTALPCFLSFDQEKKHILVSNYALRYSMMEKSMSSNVNTRYSEQLYTAAIISYPIGENGELEEAVDLWEPPVFNQEEERYNSHLHSVVKAPEKDLFVVCDLGRNKVYSLKVLEGKLQLTDTIELPDKDAQPRYSCFHPKLSLVYINGENTNKIYIYQYSEEGKLTYYDVAEMRDNRTGCKQSDITMSSDGTTLLALTRDDNKIAMFEVSMHGELSLIQLVSLEERKPKGILFIEELGMILVACPKNQKLLQFIIEKREIREVIDGEEEVICPQCIVG